MFNHPTTVCSITTPNSPLDISYTDLRKRAISRKDFYYRYQLGVQKFWNRFLKLDTRDPDYPDQYKIFDLILSNPEDKMVQKYGLAYFGLTKDVVIDKTCTPEILVKHIKEQSQRQWEITMAINGLEFADCKASLTPAIPEANVKAEPHTHLEAEVPKVKEDDVVLKEVKVGDIVNGMIIAETVLNNINSINIQDAVIRRTTTLGMSVSQMERVGPREGISRPSSEGLDTSRTAAQLLEQIRAQRAEVGDIVEDQYQVEMTAEEQEHHQNLERLRSSSNAAAAIRSDATGNLIMTAETIRQTVDSNMEEVFAEGIIRERGRANNMFQADNNALINAYAEAYAEADALVDVALAAEGHTLIQGTPANPQDLDVWGNDRANRIPPINPEDFSDRETEVIRNEDRGNTEADEDGMTI